MEPAVGESPAAQVAEYGALREEPPSPGRTRRLGELIVRLLRESGAEAAVWDGDPLLVAFRIDGREFVMGVAWARDGVEAVGAEFAEAVRGRAGGAQVVLLSMSGFAGAGAGGAVLWDRSHLEAAVCGLVTLPDLVEASSRALFFGGTTHETLAGLLASPAGDPPAGMGTPDRLPPPWPVLREGYDGIPAQLVLGGEDGWDKPSGIAAMDNSRLVVRLLTASAQGPPRASQEREVQDDNGVGRPQADVERLVIRAQVAVQDPGGSPDQVVLPLGPPSRVHCHLSRLPEQRIELDRGNASRVLSWRNRADLPAPPRPRMTTRRTPP